MYLDALTELAGWFHALDHINYARWILVHLKDTAELAERHPEIARKSGEGGFTVHKTTKVFSSIPIEQAHEQNIACTFRKLSSSGLTLNTSNGVEVFSKPILLPDLASFTPCNHEEADSQILLHASHAAQHGHQKILI